MNPPQMELVKNFRCFSRNGAEKKYLLIFLTTKGSKKIFIFFYQEKSRPPEVKL